VKEILLRMSHKEKRLSQDDDGTSQDKKQDKTGRKWDDSG